jgi:hypothetical protein
MVSPNCQRGLQKVKEYDVLQGVGLVNAPEDTLLRRQGNATKVNYNLAQLSWRAAECRTDTN